MTLARELVQQILDDPEALDMLRKGFAPKCHNGMHKLLTTKEAAAYLGISVDALDRRARAGTISSIQDAPRHKRYFSTVALEAWKA